ncbi:MAG: aminodeoxychorismate synthase, component I, partial [Sphingomonadales bacterium]|nr:aminodeoxychorismate synthase, component I [Sphingomonadales bacterium]
MRERLPTDRAFVLLDDARADGAGARLFSGHAEIVETRRIDEVEACLDRLAGLLEQGRHVAGFLGYEAGFAFEAKLATLKDEPDADAPPLLWFGAFDGVEPVAGDDLAALLGDADGAWAGAPRPDIEASAYR